MRYWMPFQRTWVGTGIWKERGKTGSMGIGGGRATAVKGISYIADVELVEGSWGKGLGKQWRGNGKSTKTMLLAWEVKLLFWCNGEKKWQAEWIRMSGDFRTGSLLIISSLEPS
jgi:hypothetical protein